MTAEEPMTWVREATHTMTWKPEGWTVYAASLMTFLENVPPRAEIEIRETMLTERLVVATWRE